jgi:hypothetical protein
MPSKLKTPLKQQEFYCLSCRKRVKCTATNICVKSFKNKKLGKVPTLRAYCKKCDCYLSKFIKHKDAARLTKKYGKTCKKH